MEIILKQDISNLGLKDDIVNVKNGYAINFLIPRGYAAQATPSIKKMHLENLKQREHKEENIREEARELGAKLEEVN
jgi:large subunit ribosomal protein L9